jgi:hypothetical protein
MLKPDDVTLPPNVYERVRKEAEKALRDADALGVFPTPVSEIMVAARLIEAHDDLAEEGVVARLRRKAEGALKRAATKVIGLFHASSRLVFIDRTLQLVKQTFVRLHETAHGLLPWQREMYAVVEDCQLSLDPDVADQFDREANVFASEVLFQLSSFITEARDFEFGIGIPLKLSKKYGASVYASVREYVRKHPRPCVVLVLNPPQLIEGPGFVASLRRVEVSRSFAERCGPVDWQKQFTPDDPIGAMVPLGKRRMTGKRQLALVDSAGRSHECLAEAFTQGYQVFVLVLVCGERTIRRVA